MFDRFSDRARMVMGLARTEAHRFNHEYLGTEHLLLGLLVEGNGIAATILRDMKVDFNQVRIEVEKICQSGPSMVTMRELPFTPRAKKVLELSIEEASNLGHNYIGTEHLLLGLIRENEGIGAQVLMNMGVKLGEVRLAVIKATAPEFKKPDASGNVKKVEEFSKSAYLEGLKPGPAVVPAPESEQSYFVYVADQCDGDGPTFEEFKTKEQLMQFVSNFRDNCPDAYIEVIHGTKLLLKETKTYELLDWPKS